MGIKSLKKNQDAADIKERVSEREIGREIKRKQGKMLEGKWALYKASQAVINRWLCVGKIRQVCDVNKE